MAHLRLANPNHCFLDTVGLSLFRRLYDADIHYRLALPYLLLP
jgi:hypothetical protein